MTVTSTIAHLTERMIHARSGVERRHARAQGWLRTRDSYIAAGNVMANDPRGRARSVELAGAAACRAMAWCCLAEGEPAQAMVWRREATRQQLAIKAALRREAGPDAKAYLGRSVTLVRDPTVKWGGMEVGGIRVSHLSHIEREMVLALTATKGSRKPFTVRRLVEAPAEPKRVTLRDRIAALDAAIAAATDAESLAAVTGSEEAKKLRDHLRQQPEGSTAAAESVRLEAAIAAAYQQHAKPEADGLDGTNTGASLDEDDSWPGPA